MANASRFFNAKKSFVEKSYMCLDEINLNFMWDERDVKEFDQMWTEGLCIYDIARAFQRDPDEVALLVIDRARKGYISDRPGGWMGRRRKL